MTGIKFRPYAYRRWRICFVAARALKHGRLASAFLALVAMRKIEIIVRRPK